MLQSHEVSFGRNNHFVLDMGLVVVLVDLSAGFDQIDRLLLLHQLRSNLRMSGSKLAWFCDLSV